MQLWSCYVDLESVYTNQVKIIKFAFYNFEMVSMKKESMIIIFTT